MKKFLFLIWMSAMLICSGCEKENMLTDFDPCKDVEYAGFRLLKNHSLNKYYTFEKINNNEDWLVAKATDRISNEDSWLVYDKKTNTFKNYPAPQDFLKFEFNMNEILYSTFSGKLESLDLTDGTVRTIYTVSDESIFSLNDFNYVDGHVYLLIKNKKTLQHSILQINLFSNSVETLLVTDKLKNTSNSNFFKESIITYKNEKQNSCIVIFFLDIEEDMIFAYSYNVDTNNEEYFETLGKVDFPSRLKESLNSRHPFVLISNNDNSYIFNFVKKQKYFIQDLSHVSGPYVFSDNGHIYDGETGQIIQTYSKPSVSFQAKYFDRENNQLFYQHRSRLGILKIDVGCKSNETSNYHTNFYMDFDRKKMYSFTNENEQTFLYEYQFN